MPTRETISAGQLANLLTGEVPETDWTTLILDCRRFTEYKNAHVRGAVNVCCSKLIRRRFLDNKLPLVQFLHQQMLSASGTSAPRCSLLQEDLATVDVIVYDDNCVNFGPKQLADYRQICHGVGAAAKMINSADDSCFLPVLLDKLVAVHFHSVKILAGGFLEFQANFPSLCEGATGASPLASPSPRQMSSSSSHRVSLSSLSQPCLSTGNVGPTKILPYLFLGSQQDAMDQENLKKYGINFVLNMSVAGPKPEQISEEHFLRLSVNDTYTEKLLPFFEKAFEFLDKVRESNGYALVHCLAGISRSPTLAIAYVMRHLRLSSDEAYRYVKEKRPSISPNFNFLGQLLEYEKLLRVKEKENVEVPSSSDQTLSEMIFATSPSLGEGMKRSSSVPMKIQKIPDKHGMRLDFGFSPESTPNRHGKRERKSSELTAAGTNSDSAAAVVRPQSFREFPVVDWTKSRGGGGGKLDEVLLKRPTVLACHSEEDMEVSDGGVDSSSTHLSDTQYFTLPITASARYPLPLDQSMFLSPTAEELSPSDPPLSQSTPTDVNEIGCAEMSGSAHHHMAAGQLDRPRTMADLPSPSTELSKLNFGGMTPTSPLPVDPSWSLSIGTNDAGRQVNEDKRKHSGLADTWVSNPFFCRVYQQGPSAPVLQASEQAAVSAMEISKPVDDEGPSLGAEPEQPVASSPPPTSRCSDVCPPFRRLSPVFRSLHKYKTSELVVTRKRHCSTHVCGRPKVSLVKGSWGGLENPLFDHRCSPLVGSQRYKRHHADIPTVSSSVQNFMCSSYSAEHIGPFRSLLGGHNIDKAARTRDLPACPHGSEPGQSTTTVSTMSSQESMAIQQQPVDVVSSGGGVGDCGTDQKTPEDPAVDKSSPITVRLRKFLKRASWPNALTAATPAAPTKPLVFPPVKDCKKLLSSTSVGLKLMMFSHSKTDAKVSPRHEPQTIGCVRGGGGAVGIVSPPKSHSEGKISSFISSGGGDAPLVNVVREKNLLKVPLAGDRLAQLGSPESGFAESPFTDSCCRDPDKDSMGSTSSLEIVVN